MADTMLALFNEISFCELFPPWNMREKTGRPSVGPPESENVIKHRGKEKGVGRAARCPRKMGKRKTPPERRVITKLQNDRKFDSHCALSEVREQTDLGGDARQLSIPHVWMLQLQSASLLEAR